MNIEDRNKLKELALAARVETDDWYSRDFLQSECYFSGVDAKFTAATNPAAILSLIAEVERQECLFIAACVDLGRVNETRGLDPDDGGADPISDAITEPRAEVERAQAVTAQVPEAAINAAVQRFLAMRLPDDFIPDFGISFTPLDHTAVAWPTGTNLFTAQQAKAIFEHCFAAAPSQQVAAPAVEAPQALSDEQIDAVYDGLEWPTYPGVMTGNSIIEMERHRRHVFARAILAAIHPAAAPAVQVQEGDERAMRVAYQEFNNRWIRDGGFVEGETYFSAGAEWQARAALAAAPAAVQPAGQDAYAQGRAAGIEEAAKAIEPTVEHWAYGRDDHVRKNFATAIRALAAKPSEGAK